MMRPSRPAFDRWSNRQLFPLSLGLFALIAGARWALYFHYGTDLPEWDQWDGEGLAIFHPISLGQFHYFGSFWQAHNEHHIALTRLVAWALAELNGQWDQRLEATFNALMPATMGAVFFVAAAQRLNWRWLAALFALMASLYALPVAWENTLSGFDSQQFFLIGLAGGALALLPFAKPYSGAWWAGATCVILSLGSMGSGFFAAAVIGAMLVGQVWRRDRTLAAAAPTLIVCGLAIAIGVMTRATVAGHEELKAQSISDFVLTVARGLGWPAFDINWGYSSLILFVPWTLLVWRMLGRSGASCPQPALAAPARWPEFLSGFGLWVVLQAVAIGYARGSGAPSPASRYIDTLIVGVVVNLLCLHLLWQTDAYIQRGRVLAALTAAWGLLCGLGVAHAALTAFTDQLPPLAEYNHYCEQNVRNYVATGDEAYLRHSEIPFPSESELKRMLDYPGIAAVLPGSVRIPLALAPAPRPGFAQTGFVRFDSRVPERLSRRSRPAPGLSPETPILSNAVTWGSFAGVRPVQPAAWESKPLHTLSGRWLKFEVAGHLGEPGVTLQLQAPQSGKVLAVVRPDKIPRDSWRSAYVHAPAGEFVISAKAEGAGKWIAFSEPVEIGAGGYWAWRLVRHGQRLAAVAAAVSAVFLAAMWRQTR
jgi:hypothetical protein